MGKANMKPNGNGPQMKTLFHLLTKQFEVNI